MPPRLPLSALLSWALVAFTIEFDNEFEHLAPHRTSVHGRAPRSPERPWLVSMVMYAKFLRFVTDEGISIRDMQRQTQIPAAELRVWLTRLAKWWNYITIQPGAASSRTSPASPKPDWLIRPTPGGRKALETWRPLTDTIEARWRQRFGKEEIQALRSSLRSLVDQLPADLPRTLPILGFGLLCKPPQSTENRVKAPTPYDLSLPALLSTVLYAFAIAFEDNSDVSLAISANILRVFDQDAPDATDATNAIDASELARLASVSKEAVIMSFSFLLRRGYLTTAKAGSKSRGKRFALTTKGRNAAQHYQTLTQAIEDHWIQEFGKEQIARLRTSLESFTADSRPGTSPLFLGLTPYPDGWRASQPRPLGLPNFPMILHRGGFPDGS